MELEKEEVIERDRASGGDDPDRLSALPDCLLHTIMSFLKARQVVQTCVLATRWKHLWRSVPCLNIDLDEFGTESLLVEWYSGSDLDSSDSDRDISEDVSKRMGKGWQEEWEDFEDFTQNLMHRCNIALLDSFRLSVCRGGIPLFADRRAGGWLRRAMKYCTPDPPRQREGLSSNCWHLRRLYICNVALDNRFAEHVSSVCHLLEDLELEDCVCSIRAIASHSLKNLVLKDCRWRILSEITSSTLKILVIAGGTNTGDSVLVIVAPVIAHLCLDVPLRFARRISVNQTPSLPRL